MSDTQEDTLRGVVARIVSERDDWIALKLKNGVSVSGKGLLAPIGAEVVFRGTWSEHHKYGPQFKAVSSFQDIPNDVRALKVFLAKNLKGIGEKKAEALIEHFGESVIDAFFDPGQEIRSVLKANDEVFSAWRAHLAKLREGVEWAKLGLDPRLLKKLNEANYKVSNFLKDPFDCILKVSGVGWETVDKAATTLNSDLRSPKRIYAGIYHAMTTITESHGHVYVPTKTLTRGAGKLLGFSGESLIPYAESSFKLTVLDDRLVALKRYHEMELWVQGRIQKYLELDFDPNINENYTPPDQLSYEQLKAIDDSKVYPIMVITGPPGAGKTMVLNEIIKSKSADTNIVLCAPTGKAAQRMRELTGLPAQTIHSTFGIAPGGFSRRTEPFEADVLVIDEFSMVTLPLFNTILQNVSLDTQLVLVGDADQLPAIGIGNVLHDLIDEVPTTKLTKIFRQDSGSKIIELAQSVRRGQGISVEEFAEEYNDNPELGLQFYSANDPYGFLDVFGQVNEKDPVDLKDTIILSPVKKGGLGTKILNSAMQAYVHELEDMQDKGYQVGDRIIVTKNEAFPGVVNGDTGFVISVKGNVMTFRLLDSREFEAPVNHMDIELNYAMTVHKCVHPDTWVETDRGLQRIRDIDKDGMIASKGGLQVYKNRFTYPESRLLRFKTQDSYEIQVTKNHGMLVWNGESYVRKEAKDVLPGTFVCMPLESSLIACKKGELPPPPYRLNNEPGHVSIPLEMTEELATFLGLVMSKGTLLRRSIRINTTAPEINKFLEDACWSLFKVRVDETSKALHIRSYDVMLWVFKMLGKVFQIPECILQSGNMYRSAFLKGFFYDCTIQKSGDTFRGVELIQKNPNVCEIIRLMLLSLGIPSSMRLKSGSPCLTIESHYAKIFKKKVGFMRMLTAGRFPEKVPHSRMHKVPISKVEIESIKDNLLKISQYAYSVAVSRGYLTTRVIEYLRGQNDPKVQFILDRSDKYHHTQIDTIDTSFEYSESMCVEVPSTGNFVQNGMLLCNSQGSEYKRVIAVFPNSCKWSLTRELVYTGFTRARKSLIVVTESPDILAKPLKKGTERLTKLMRHKITR